MKILPKNAIDSKYQTNLDDKFNTIDSLAVDHNEIVLAVNGFLVTDNLALSYACSICCMQKKNVFSIC